MGGEVRFPFSLMQWHSTGLVLHLGDIWQRLETFLRATSAVGAGPGHSGNELLHGRVLPNDPEEAFS